MNRKITVFVSFVLSILMVFSLAACGANTEKVNVGGDGIIGERKNNTSGIRSGYDDLGEMPEIAFGEKATSIDGDGTSAYYGEYSSNGIEPEAGLLTAGEWNDVKNLDDFIAKFEEYGLWDGFVKGRQLYSQNIIPVHVTADGNVFNQKVFLYEFGGTSPIYIARTDINGYAYLFYSNNSQTTKYTIKTGNKEADVALPDLKENMSPIEIKISDGNNNVDKLDLMFMVDTTGSMSDELEFIKAELIDIVKRVSSASENGISIRISVNFYRDEGDDYVVKYFAFRDDVEECVQIISEQSAEGGGDFPEAVHTALDNAVTGHEWRDDAVKLCLFVLDAPPHSESEIQGISKSINDSIKAAAENGIRIIPVASSGIDAETEYILRSFSVMTGGTYIFITDDSGIGGSHLDPSVGDYEVETLNECIIRVISEFCGVPYEKPVKPVEQQTEPVNGQQ